MAILTTTEYGTVDCSTGYGDINIVYIGLLVKEYTLVTLTCTKQIAGNGVGGNLIKCTWYTQSTTAHDDSAFSICRDSCTMPHIGQLITAIKVGKDVTTGNFHSGIATYRSSFPVPFAFSCVGIFIRVVTRTASEHISIESMTVRTYRHSTFCIFLVARIIIILSVFLILIYSIRVIRCIRSLI